MRLPGLPAALIAGRRHLGGLAGLPTAFDSGRFCPPHYGYGAKRLAKCETDEADTLLIGGGVYGNPEALDAIERRFQQERVLAGSTGQVRVVLNGDFNFLNATPQAWEAVNRRVYAAAPDGWSATLGNVEFEAARLGGLEFASGCGCAYPDWVADDVVRRSNEIVQRLRQSAFDAPTWTCDWLKTLPMYAACRVGTARVSIVHGDPLALAGWSLSAELLNEVRVAEWLGQADADLFASSHTCIAHAREIPREDPRGPGAVFNNGAAGMPNFAHVRWGVLTRVSADWKRVPADSLYGIVLGAHGVRVDAIPVRYDVDGWQRTFDSWWTEGSAARVSYSGRIAHGLRGWTVEDAYPAQGIQRATRARSVAASCGPGGGICGSEALA